MLVGCGRRGWGLWVALFLGSGGASGAFPPTPHEALDGMARDQVGIAVSQNRRGTSFYTGNAVAAQGLFSLEASINGTLFYPIEVAGTLRAGSPDCQARAVPTPAAPNTFYRLTVR